MRSACWSPDGLGYGTLVEVADALVVPVGGSLVGSSVVGGGGVVGVGAGVVGAGVVGGGVVGAGVVGAGTTGGATLVVPGTAIDDVPVAGRARLTRGAA